MQSFKYKQSSPIVTSVQKLLGLLDRNEANFLTEKSFVYPLLDFTSQGQVKMGSSLCFPGKLCEYVILRPPKKVVTLLPVYVYFSEQQQKLPQNRICENGFPVDSCLGNNCCEYRATTIYRYLELFKSIRYNHSKFVHTPIFQYVIRRMQSQPVCK